jgi:8-oxo-dGTP diphosphatase
MPFDYLACPKCGEPVRFYRNPIPTVDIIIETDGGIVLIARRNEPLGWALPGGFVDYGETLEAAAVREAREETSLEVENLRLLGCYSDPGRDPRQHNISTVYVATAKGTPRGADDAAEAAVFPLDAIPKELCFDHDRIIADYLARKRSGLI